MDSNRLMDQTRMGLAGYSPYEGDMRGIFLAQGPGIVIAISYNLQLARVGFPPAPSNLFLFVNQLNSRQHNLPFTEIICLHFQN